MAQKHIPKFPLSSLFASKWRSFKRRSTDSAREKGASLNSYQPCKALLYESIILLLPVGKKSHQKPNMSISYSIWLQCMYINIVCSIKVNMLIRTNIIYTSLSTSHVSKAMMSILVYHDMSTHWHCQCHILTCRPSNLTVLKRVSNVKALQQHVSKEIWMEAGQLWSRNDGLIPSESLTYTTFPTIGFVTFHNFHFHKTISANVLAWWFGAWWLGFLGSKPTWVAYAPTGFFPFQSHFSKPWWDALEVHIPMAEHWEMWRWTWKI